MSLNGLDDAKVTEAYQGALAEGGGWFLLKYASRDAVEVLARGTGGASEARGAVAQYEETSPLYGFLLYRRRKVLIKYVPDGTSRLLQARVAVHFTAVSEKFTPHDTVISITSADELSDSALAAACSLHTAAPSNCSSSSSSRRKLDEITEDADEEGPAAPDDSISSISRPTTAASSKATITGPVLTETKSSVSQSVPAVPTLSTTHIDGPSSAEDPKSAVSSRTVESGVEDAVGDSKPSEYRDSLKEYDALFEYGPDPRLSSQTARPAMSDMYAEIYAKYKPKVKLGPRPRPSLDTKRPHTSGSGSQGASRPVSSLPAGLRVANRKTAEPKRPKSRDSSTVPSIAFPPPPPVPAVPSIPDFPPPSPTYPPRSPASVRSMPIHSHSHRDRVTPEKQRLMKALELRKKQLKARQEKEEKVKEEPTKEVEEEAKDVVQPTTEKNKEEASENNPTKEDGVEVSDDTVPGAQEDLQTVTDEPRIDPSMIPIPEDDEDEETTPTAAPNEGRPTTMIKANDTTPTVTPEPSIAAEETPDATIGQSESDDLQSAASACSPTSAQTQGSSVAPSTRPSSISEDDKTPEQELKKEDLVATPLPQSIEVPQLPQHAEKESIESSPTVVPESTTPVPSFEVTLQEESEPTPVFEAAASEDVTTKRSKRESMVLRPVGGDEKEQRRSKRESMIFMPSQESSQQGEAAARRRSNRESMIFNPSKRHSRLESTDKGLAPLDTVTPHISAENSEAEYLSDDSFMEELRTATVEEAKPVSVSISKSPITPIFPRKSSISGTSLSERSVSQPQRIGRLSPDQPLPRKSSGPWMPHSNSDTAVVAKKINVSSGISQRIKALAEKSNRDSVASVSSVATPDSSASIIQRKSSFFATPPSGNSPNSQPVKRFNRASFINVPHSPSPDRQSVLQRPASRDETPVYNVQHALRKPETVQVTARIIRDGRAERPTLTMPDENTPLDLQQSQITIDHQKTISPILTSPKSPVKAKVEPASPRPPSSSHSREQTAALPRSSSESSWRSFGRRLSESRSEVKSPRSHSTHSFDSTEERKEEKKEKKDSRASKLFKRMSTMSSLSRKNSAVGSLQEEDRPSTSLPSLREPPPAVQVGDLNVQFPDTLLWKRRWVEIDASGNLVLSLSRSNEQSKGITKRFHLSEFSAPYAPDQDRQELPNSVVLDFNDGRTLQCACETYMAQAQVLQILREAHDAWIAYNQGA